MALSPFACGEKKLITSSSKKVSPVASRRWAYASQVHPPADGARLQLDGPVAAVPVSFQDAFQIGEKEDVHTGVRRQLLLQSKMVSLGAEFPCLQELHGVLLASEEVSTLLEPLYRMHDQVKIVELRAGGSRKSDGRPRLAQSTMVESWFSVMDAVLSKVRLEPRGVGSPAQSRPSVVVLPAVAVFHVPLDERWHNRFGSTSRTMDGEHVFWAEFFFHHKPPPTKAGQLEQCPLWTA
jgi:hypothetical protein